MRLTVYLRRKLRSLLYSFFLSLCRRSPVSFLFAIPFSFLSYSTFSSCSPSSFFIFSSCFCSAPWMSSWMPLLRPLLLLLLLLLPSFRNGDVGFPLHVQPIRTKEQPIPFHGRASLHYGCRKKEGCQCWMDVRPVCVSRKWKSLRAKIRFIDLILYLNKKKILKK